MKINNNIVLTKLGKDYIAYDNNLHILHELNQPAFLIVDSIKKGMNTKQILKQIQNKYEVDKKKAQKDLESFLKILLKLKLITVKK